MKKFIRGLFIFIASIIFLAGLALVSMVIYAPAYFSPGNPGSCTQYYVGVDKGMIWNNGEWHHYVDVAVDTQQPFLNWEIVEQPLPSSIWSDDLSKPYYKRIGYQWPDNWWDPFPAKSWRICY